MMHGGRRSPRAKRSAGVALAAALALTSAPLGAATLCRDLKGLFTPCPPGPRHAAAARAAASAAPSGDAPIERDHPPHKASTKPPRIAKTRLCRDLKGLFTPCPG